MNHKMFWILVLLLINVDSIQIRLGRHHVLVIQENGKVYGWGFGQAIGLSAASASVVQIYGLNHVTEGCAGDTHSVFVDNGVVKTISVDPEIGGDTVPHVNATATPLVGVRAVGCGSSHTCAIYTNDTLVCWGRNVNGQLGVGNFVSNYKAEGLGLLASMIDGGLDHTCILNPAGGVLCSGSNDKKQSGGTVTTSKLLLWAKKPLHP